jgi:hypothetical protein
MFLVWSLLLFISHQVFNLYIPFRINWILVSFLSILFLRLYVKIDNIFLILLCLDFDLLILKLISRFHWVNLLPLRHLCPVWFIFCILLYFLNLFLIDWLLIVDFGLTRWTLNFFCRTVNLLLLVTY